MSHKWRSYVTHKYVTHILESCHIDMGVMSHIHPPEPSASGKESSARERKDTTSVSLALSLSLYPSPTLSFSLSLVDIYIMSGITHTPVHVWHCAFCIHTTERESVTWLPYVCVHHAEPPANKREPPSCIDWCVFDYSMCVWHRSLRIHPMTSYNIIRVTSLIMPSSHRAVSKRRKSLQHMLLYVSWIVISVLDTTHYAYTIRRHTTSNINIGL